MTKKQEDFSKFIFETCYGECGIERIKRFLQERRLVIMLTKKEMSRIVENDLIPFSVIVDRKIVDEVENDDSTDSFDRFEEKISMMVSGTDKCYIHCFYTVKNDLDSTVKVFGKLNVSEYLFPEHSGNDFLIEEMYEIEE